MSLLTSYTSFPVISDQLSSLYQSIYDWNSSVTIDEDIKIYDELSTIGIQGSGTNNIKKYLTYMEFGSGILSIDDYCCYNCSSLLSVNLNMAKHIGKYAFANTTSMQECVQLSDNIFYSIDDYAFYNSKIKRLDLDLRGKDYSYDDYEGCIDTDIDNGPYIGLSAFANCKSLTDVNLINSTYLSEGEFMNCTNLKNVQFANHGGCVGARCFQGCTSLQSITLPVHFLCISDSMFRGCTNLSSVVITQENDNSLQSIENDAFYGCSKLSSITLPDSIKSLDQLSQYALRGSSINQIHLNGVSEETLKQYVKTGVSTTQINEDKTTNGNFKYGTMYGTPNIAMDMVSYAMNNHIPLFAIRCNTGCGYCTSFYNNVLNKTVFQTWMANSPYLFLKQIKSADSNSTNSTFMNWKNGGKTTISYNGSNVDFKISWDGHETTYPILMAFWYKSDGTYVAKQWRNDGYVTNSKGCSTNKAVDPQDICDLIDSYFSGYTKQSQFTSSTSTSGQTISFQGWGRNANITLFSRENTKFTYNKAKNAIVKG